MALKFRQTRKSMKRKSMKKDPPGSYGLGDAALGDGVSCAGVKGTVGTPFRGGGYAFLLVDGRHPDVKLKEIPFVGWAFSIKNPPFSKSDQLKPVTLSLSSSCRSIFNPTLSIVSLAMALIFAGDNEA